MSNDHNIPGVEVRAVKKTDILRAMAALETIVELGTANGRDMEDDAESLARMKEAFGVDTEHPPMWSPQMQ